MTDDYSDYELAASPWGRNRADLERYALVTSWDTVETARQILEFPDEAWVRMGHRVCARAVRKILQLGMEPDPLMIVETVRQNDPEYLEDARAVEEWHNHNILGLGALQKSAMRLFRQEYQRESAVRAMQVASSSIRSKSYGDWYRAFSAQVASLAPGIDDKYKIKTLDVLMEEEIHKLLHPEDFPEAQPVSSGWKALDCQIGGGFFRGDNVLIVGAPGMGKTTLMAQFAANLSLEKVPSYFLSLEMKRHKMVRRVCAQALQKQMNDLEPADFTDALKLKGCYSRIHFDDRFCKVVDYVSRAAAFKHKNPDAFALFGDYAGSLQNHNGGNPTEEANKVSSGWYETAKSLGYCSFLGQQPTKAYRAAGVPNLAFIRDTGKFEYDADLVLWLHHPWAFDKTKPRNYHQLWIMKNREGSIGVIIHLNWEDGRFTMQPWEGVIPGGEGSSRRVDPKAIAANDDTYETIDELEIDI